MDENKDQQPLEPQNEENAPQPKQGGKLQEELLNQFLQAYNRKRNKFKLSKSVLKKQEKERKSKRREANKSRKINQKKAKYNKFTKK